MGRENQFMGIQILSNVYALTHLKKASIMHAIIYIIEHIFSTLKWDSFFFQFVLFNRNICSNNVLSFLFVCFVLLFLSSGNCHNYEVNIKLKPGDGCVTACGLETDFLTFSLFCCKEITWHWGLHWNETYRSSTDHQWEFPLLCYVLLWSDVHTHSS